jgi:hypothetical protein
MTLTQRIAKAIRYDRQVTLRDKATGVPYLITARNVDSFDEMEARARKFYGIPQTHELNVEAIDQIRAR